jgi:hypothetical protein
VYLCKCCHGCSPPGRKRLLHYVYRTIIDKQTLRPRREVAAEYPVCPSCKAELDRGATVREVIARYVPWPERGPEPARQVAPPPPAPVVGQPVNLSGVVIKPGGIGFTKKAPPQKPAKPRCDVCGADATGGQVDAETTLCPKHVVGFHAAARELADKVARKEAYPKNGRGAKK